MSHQKISSEKIARLYLQKQAQGQPRLPKYGEIYRQTLANGKATIVIRGIFQQRKGDSYHIRVLRGQGLPSEERIRGSVLWYDDVYDAAENPRLAFLEALRLVKRWMNSPQGKRVLGAA